MANMLTAYDVKRYAPAGRNYPEVNICEAIPQIEEEFGYTCLGKTLYEWLLTKLTPYPDTVVEYDPNTEYGLDEYVVRNGCLFISPVACNRTDPLDPDTDWSPVQRFTDACANTFWELYLRRILALTVYKNVVVYDTQASGAAGVTINQGDGYNTGNRAANKGEIADRQKQLEQDVNTTVSNMYRWIQRKIDAGECSDMPFQSACDCFSQSCKQPRRGIRRFAFRV